MSEENDPGPETEAKVDHDAIWQWHCEQALAAVRSSEGNPLFLWRLLEEWDNAGRAQLYRNAPGNSPAAEPLRQPVPRPALPAWAQDWLADLAHSMRHLMEGRDERKRPPTSASWQEEREWLYRKTLSPTQRASLVPLVMGFTREEGWNAFSQYATIRSAQAAGNWKEILTQPPLPESGRRAMTRGEAHRRVMSEHGFTDDRAFRRFLAKGRDARGASEHPLERELREEEANRANRPTKE